MSDESSSDEKHGAYAGEEKDSRQVASVPERDSTSWNNSLLWRAVESTAFLALVTAVLYFLGHSYFAGFFYRLSFPKPFPQLTTSDYLIQAFSNFASLILIVYSLSSLKFVNYEPKNRQEAWYVNSHFLAISAWMAYSALEGDFLSNQLRVFLGVIAGVGIFGGFFNLNVTASAIKNFGVIPATIVYGFFFLYVFVIFFQSMGAAAATEFVEGKAGATRAILQTKGGYPAIDGVPLLVVLDRGDRYYLVKEENPAPYAPIIYVVEASDVLQLEMQRQPVTRATPETDFQPESSTPVTGTAGTSSR